MDNHIQISMDVAGATYPVTIDPIVANGTPQNPNKVLEINQSYMWLGFSVSSAGDVNGDGYSDVIVGAPQYDKGQNNEGAAFIYPGSPSGLTLNAVTLECNQADAKMGYSVSSAGDMNGDGYSDVLVGAPYYDHNTSNDGAIFIYKGSNSGVDPTVLPITMTLGQAESNLGISVAPAGDVNGDGFSDMLAGAHQFDHSELNEGIGVLVYGAQNGLGLVTFLESNQPGAMMGFAVAGAGDTNGDGFSDVMVGARLYSHDQALEGAAFIFKGSAQGVVTANPLIIECNQADARLGHALSSAGDVNGDGYADVAIGAYQYDNGNSNEGAVFIHYGSSSGINSVPALTLESNQAEAQLGFSVSCAGDVNGDGFADLIAGARYYSKGQNHEGAAFVYHGSKTGLDPIAASTLESNQADAWLGSAVAAAGDVNGDGYSDVIVGAYAFDNGQKDEGSVFVWHGQGSSINESVVTNLEINFSSSQFGWDVASAGDVNGDGFGDVIISANNYDNGQPAEGAAFVFHGSAQGLVNVPNMIIESNQQHVGLGSVSSANDVNGDGFGDVIIGMPLYDIGTSNEGKASILYGSPSGLSHLNETTILGTQHEGNLGASVASAGDLNKDGYGDIVVGESGYDLSNWEYSDEGRVWIYYGSEDGIDSNGTVLNGKPDNLNFGYSVAGADVNADGYSDILASSPFYSGQEYFEGAVLVYFGSQGGLSLLDPMILQSNVMSARMGEGIAVGDFNGDGYNDIATGAVGYSNPQNEEGALILYYGSSNGINGMPTIIEGNIANGYFGRVSSVGDANGDGYGDLVVGSYAYSSGQANEGAFYLFLGSATGISNSYSLMVESNQASAFLGNSVAGGGDINGDGYGDIIASAHQYDNQQLNEGRASVYYGNSTLATQNNLRLYNSDLTTVINHTQFPQPDFGAGLYAKSFLGNNKGKLVWETKPVGQGFSKGSNNLITNSVQSSGSQNLYTSLGLAGVELKNVIAKQGPATKVRTRVKYDLVLAMTGQMYGPWRYLPAYLQGNSTSPVPENATDSTAALVEQIAATTALDGIENSAIIYPNPASVKLHIRMDNPEMIQNVKLFTSTGQIVYESQKHQETIDVKGFAAGTYILWITHRDGSQTNRRVVIR